MTPRFSDPQDLRVLFLEAAFFLFQARSAIRAVVGTAFKSSAESEEVLADDFVGFLPLGFFGSGIPTGIPAASKVKTRTNDFDRPRVNLMLAARNGRDMSVECNVLDRQVTRGAMVRAPSGGEIRRCRCLMPFPPTE